MLGIWTEAKALASVQIPSILCKVSPNVKENPLMVGIQGELLSLKEPNSPCCLDKELLGAREK
jgi:hypothetical protein